MDFFALAKRMPDVEFIWAGGFSFGKISDGYEEIKKEMEHLSLIHISLWFPLLFSIIPNS